MKKDPKKEKERLRELIEEATLDCYDEEEQCSGLLAMIEENVICPFHARVIGEEVLVTDLEPHKSGLGLYAVCKYKDKEYRVDVTSLEWIKPLPEGFEWLEAYQFWREGNSCR